MTTRRWMFAVAILAMAFAGAARVANYWRLAKYHRHEAEKVHDLLYYLAFAPAPAGFRQPPPPDVVNRETRLWDEFRAYHERMSHQYQRAVFRPWMIVNSDHSPPAEPVTLTEALDEVRQDSKGETDKSSRSRPH